MNVEAASSSKRPMRMRAPVVAAVLGCGIMAYTLSAAAIPEGSRAPEIGLEDTQGRPIRMAALRGKVVVVDFWASWCEPCREAMPVLNRLYQQHRDDGLVVVGVSVDRQARNMTRFLRRTRVGFPVVHDSDQRVAARYEPPTMPSTYVIDRRGVIRHVHQGYRSGDGERLEREVRALLRQRR